MKNKLVYITKILTIVSIISIILISFLGCNGTPRLSTYEGSAHWALEKAQPEINSFDPNAEIYWIMGAGVWKDGRLPLNTGSWSFTCWSSSRQEICDVVVNYSGNTSTSTRTRTNPPSTGSGQPIPTDWHNSTIIFDAIPLKEKTDNYANLLTYNLYDYGDVNNIASGKAVWAINFTGGKNPLVMDDDHSVIFIGTELK